MIHRIVLALLVTLPAGTCFAAEPALKGYDPVAYFTDGKATPGESGITLTFAGQTLRFSTASHREMFREAPAKWMPQYEGQCAYAMSQGQQTPADPQAFSIRDGRLYLFSKPELVKEFDRKWTQLKADADRYWMAFLKTRKANP